VSLKLVSASTKPPSRETPFAADRPVFNLPAGYTANSVQAGILDNRLSAVPVPAAAPLLAVALTGLLAWRSRAQRPSRPLG